MKLPNISITTTTRKQCPTNGELAAYKQFHVNFKDPLSGRRVRRAFDTKKAAEASRDGLLRQFVDGSYADPTSAPTVAEAVAHWLADREGQVLADYPATVVGQNRAARPCIPQYSLPAANPASSANGTK